MLELTGSKIILKEFTRDHLHDPRYFGWLRDIEVVNTIYRIEYLMNTDFAEVEQYFDQLVKGKKDVLFAIHEKESDSFIGTHKIGHINFRSGTADMGIMIGEKDAWGKGYAKDVIRTGASYAFNILSLRKLTGGTISTNTAMCRCFESLGFKAEARLRQQLLFKGEYVDHTLYGLFKEELI